MVKSQGHHTGLREAEDVGNSCHAPHWLLRQQQTPHSFARCGGLPVGSLGDDAFAAGCHAGLERNPGHHPVPLGSQPGHHRRPSHLSDHCRDDRRPAGSNGPRHHGLRFLVRLRDLRRRHGYLLGTRPDTRVPRRRDLAAAPGRQNRDRSRCDQSGLDLSIRPEGRIGRAQSGGAARIPGLVSQVLPEIGSGRGRGRIARRVHSAVSDQRRS